jgi:predicted lipoprotein
MRRLISCLLFAAACASSHAQDSIDDAAVQASKEAMLRHLAHDVLLPLTDAFASASERLAGAGAAFCAGSGSLGQMQSAWRATQAAWQPLEMLQIGPIIERRTQRRLNAWPVRPKLLGRLLNASGPITDEQLELAGAAGKGLPALEYLLFDQEATARKLAATHCNVLQALASDIRHEARALADAWRTPDGGFARQLAEAGRHPQDGRFASTDQALSDVVNLLIAGVDAIRIRKVGKPLDKSGDTAALERIESWRSGSSLDHLRDNLLGFELMFFGAGDEGVGLDDYLLQIERPILVRNVREQLQVTRQALAAIRPPLHQALVSQRAQVEQLHQALERLQYYLETQLADALKVDPGFNANDGD